MDTPKLDQTPGPAPFIASDARIDIIHLFITPTDDYPLILRNRRISISTSLVSVSSIFGCVSERNLESPTPWADCGPNQSHSYGSWGEEIGARGNRQVCLEDYLLAHQCCDLIISSQGNKNHIPLPQCILNIIDFTSSIPCVQALSSRLPSRMRSEFQRLPNHLQRAFNTSVSSEKLKIPYYSGKEG